MLAPKNGTVGQICESRSRITTDKKRRVSYRRRAV